MPSETTRQLIGHRGTQGRQQRENTHPPQPLITGASEKSGERRVASAAAACVGARDVHQGRG